MEEEMWKKLLLEGPGGMSPERREQLISEAKAVADDREITPGEAFQRGVQAGIKAVSEELLDRLETFAAFRAAFPKDTPRT